MALGGGGEEWWKGVGGVVGHWKAGDIEGVAKLDRAVSQNLNTYNNIGI